VSGHSFGGFTALAVASGFGPVPADPRVAAIAPISPASSILSDEALESIRIPALILGGTADITTPVEPESARPFELLSSRPRYRLDIVDAGHNSFTETCAILDALLGAGIPPEILEFLIDAAAEGCAPELIPIEEAHRITRLYAVSFLQRYVAGGKRYKTYLTRRSASEEPDAIFSKLPGGGPKRLELASAGAR
jgi:predicted dienelactone hydrolase